MTLENVEPPTEIGADEPFAREFSMERAARYLDQAALDWQKNQSCVACHTMLPYIAMSLTYCQRKKRQRSSPI